MATIPEPARAPSRVLTRRYIVAMVALDTVEGLIVRTRNLLSYGRRITRVNRYIHNKDHPTVTAGLTTSPADIDVWHRNGGVGIAVRLQPGIWRFGFGALNDWPTERGVWERYYAAAEAKRNPDSLTQVVINGGLPGDGPSTEDLIVISRWNSNGVCEETTIAFDNTEKG